MNTNIDFVERLRFRFKTLQHKFVQNRLATRETVVVDTQYGKVRGLKRNTVYNHSYYSFEGIPYASPPVGALRFKAPVPPQPWQDIRDCTSHKDKATQVHFVHNQVHGSEDCLYLNVYTNSLNVDKNERRPVLVFIHGGGFILGEANRDWYGPDYFMQEDVVLITIQYRLGVLGFLSLNDPQLDVPGNAGLKDQVLALKWIRDNCGNFGGNKDCITVFGESAGAASTHYMMLTEQTNGIFHRAILMSGSAYCPWAFTECQHRAFEIAKMAGYRGENVDSDVFDFLRKADVKDLVRVESLVLSPEERKQKVMFAFGPTIEPYITDHCVLPEHPKELMKQSWSNMIPVLAGNTSFEGLLFKPEVKLMPDCLKELNTCYNYVPRELAELLEHDDHIKERGLRLREAHVSGDAATPDEYLDFCSQFWFWFPAHRFIRARLEYAPMAPTYLYRYDFDGEVLITPYRIMRYGRGVKGVSHADDLGYLFWNLMSSRVDEKSRDYINVKRSVGIWSQFAATGNPHHEDIPGMKDIKWEPLKKHDDVHKCLNISDTLELIPLPEMEKIKVLEDIYGEHKHLIC